MVYRVDQAPIPAACFLLAQTGVTAQLSPNAHIQTTVLGVAGFQFGEIAKPLEIEIHHPNVSTMTCMSRTVTWYV